MNLSLQLDANKSPLALLAKTCSSIGVDQPNSKLLASADKNRSVDHTISHSASSDKRKTGSSSVNSVNGDEDSSQSNTTSSNSAKLSFKPYELSNKKSNNFNNNHGERNCDSNNDVTVSDKKSPNLKVSPSPKSTASTARNSPASGKNSPSGRQSSNGVNDTSTKTKSENHSPKHSPHTTSASNGTPVSSMSSTTTSSALSFTSLGLPDMRLDSHKDSIASLSNLYKTNPFLSNCCPSNGVGPTHHLSVDKTGAYPSIYPPLNYARMKSLNGGQPMLPNMCRDPYCNGNCQLSVMQSAALLASAAAANSCNPNSCPNGCNQCDHQRLMSSALAVSSAYPHLNPALIPGLSQAYASGLYSGLNPSSLQRPQSAPNVCNWIAGDNHCGKRFANSEELLQHLRTHTSSNLESSTSMASLLNPSMASGLAAHMHYSTAGTAPPPSLTTAAGLRRTYPTSLSPLSNRFHPYKPPVMSGLGALPSIPSMNPLAGTQMPNSSALSMYYPYGLYSGRIGPPVHQ